MRFIDLHVHTTASDGSFTPSEVCQMALDKGLAALAITDHDTVHEKSSAGPGYTGFSPYGIDSRYRTFVQLWFTRDPYSGLLYGLYQSRTSC